MGDTKKLLLFVNRVPKSFSLNDFSKENCLSILQDICDFWNVSDKESDELTSLLELFIDTNIWSFYWLYKNAVPKDFEVEKYIHQEISNVLPKFYSLVNTNNLLSSYILHMVYYLDYLFVATRAHKPLLESCYSSERIHFYFQKYYASLENTEYLGLSVLNSNIELLGYKRTDFYYRQIAKASRNSFYYTKYVLGMNSLDDTQTKQILKSAVKLDSSHYQAQYHLFRFMGQETLDYATMLFQMMKKMNVFSIEEYIRFQDIEYYLKNLNAQKVYFFQNVSTSGSYNQILKEIQLTFHKIASSKLYDKVWQNMKTLQGYENEEVRTKINQNILSLSKNLFL